MVKITKSITLEIEKDGQKITIGPDELADIKRQLDAAIRERGREFRKKVEIGRAKASVRVYHMSDAKRKEIMENVDKKLSSTPKTLSALLDGVSYVPNYLPAIRKMVEGKQNVAKKQVGKRTFYSLKKH